MIDLAQWPPDCRAPRKLKKKKAKRNIHWIRCAWEDGTLFKTWVKYPAHPPITFTVRLPE